MSSSPSRTVAIIGASYGGARVAHLLAQGLPERWRVVLIDRNSHMNHLYVLPRYSVLPGHEHKAFIPYKNVFLPPPAFDAPSTSSPPSPIGSSPHVFLHAAVTSLSEHSLVLDRAFPEHGVAESDRTLHFDFLVYALGSHLPAPINLWGPVADEDVEKADVLDVSRGTKEGGVVWLKRFQKRVERASSVLVVGGGALGIQFASDIAEIHPATRVTLLHSRARLLPRFDEGMHTEILSTLATLNVCTILGDRLDLSSLQQKRTQDGERVVRTQSGREIRAELVLLCTGQTPNTALLREAFPESVIPDGPDRGMARVRRTLQLAKPAPIDALPEIEEDPATRVAAEHVFAIGDAADAFGAVNAGHNAFFQGEVAARNVLRLVRRREGLAAASEDRTLERYAPGPPAIKVSLGLNKSVYQFQGVIGTKEQEPPDLDVHLIWRYYGYHVSREDLEADFEASAPADAK
ncbi:iron uptake cluster protein [Dichomitus squalens LYAD-421 SS1]|uniref:Iron uptake cluster protein n=1 Tax=Dichomitus squalens (strain LYAD-421) TaxID=732165 RepID=R7T0Z8_DICSQ|nr:iron uptake cluster protein [Dichomitus squalens LYAD-421 SS1]EJF61918.1 iron uptake cluster protein [Dichomitus squalens LYAD-421 SS1]